MCLCNEKIFSVVGGHHPIAINNIALMVWLLLGVTCSLMVLTIRKTLRREPMILDVYDSKIASDAVRKFCTTGEIINPPMTCDQAWHVYNLCLSVNSLMRMYIVYVRNGFSNVSCGTCRNHRNVKTNDRN